MKIETKINEASLKCYAYAREVLPFVALGVLLYCFMTNDSFAAGVNRLSGLKDDIGATFGSGSDTEYFIYLAEGLLAAMGFMKTKNIMLLGGLPLLMVFTHWALK